MIATSATIRWTAIPFLVAALAGCGSSGTRHAPAPAPATTAIPAVTPAAAAKLGPITLARPRAGQTLGARTAGGDLIATLEVRGRAAPRQSLYVQAACTLPSCERLGPSDRHGRFAIHATVSAPAGAPALAVSVGYTDPASGRAPIALTVTLRAPPATTPAVPAHLHTPAALPEIKPLPPIPAPAGSPSQSPPPVRSTTPAAATAGARPLVVIGDSLAVGTRAPLAAALPGWPTITDARVNRGLAEGMRVLARTPITAPDTILAFSLFTNDDPGNVAALLQAVVKSVSRLGAHGCAIWATIHRAPVDGVSYDQANAALVALAATLHGRVLIVPWDAQATRHAQWLAPDGVHGTTVGYEQRANLYAQAATSCTA